MGIGLLVLYAALAMVALWLIAELLLQNRAPLHWRGVALVGFLLVVAGMAVRSVPLIGAGAAAFAVGQVFVTLSVKRGYTTGWSLRATDGSLPAPLAKVPLLSAATGGAAVVTAAAVAAVGEVGPIEESDQEVLPEPAADAVDEVAGAVEEDYGVYETGYQQTQPYAQYAVPYADQCAEQQWQQQPGYDYQQQGYPAYQQPQEQYGYAEQQWQQQAQAQAQAAWDQAQHQGYQGYQEYQPYGAIPQQQPGYDHQQQDRPQPEAWQQ